MAYIALILIVLSGVLGYAPGLPEDIAGVPLGPARAAVRSAAQRAGTFTASIGARVRQEAMALLREQLHDAIDETVQ
jgi:hypothetical protein